MKEQNLGVERGDAQGNASRRGGYRGTEQPQAGSCCLRTGPGVC